MELYYFCRGRVYPSTYDEEMVAYLLGKPENSQIEMIYFFATPEEVA